MDSVSPVLTEVEVSAEQVIALGQPNYYPIIVARIRHEDVSGHPTNVSYTRFRFTDQERSLLAAGADLLLGQPHHHAMMPVSVQLAMPGEYPTQEGS